MTKSDTCSDESFSFSLTRNGKFESATFREFFFVQRRLLQNWSNDRVSQSSRKNTSKDKFTICESTEGTTGICLPIGIGSETWVFD